ncbi:MAG TPA: gas vesicle protein GvpD [Nitrospira sp.]|nr:AAA family ATPase [Nitrospira sp.]MCW5796202.1 AAA family ATPase [Nitrospira sp.]HMU30913.1 gas vesicle protein GvpD [Nitrospira sp.]HMX91967.1 gas vesicle protein GvpD [Nitrospira sp.]HMZ96196.1 gas vesicle protein GvpD [Nitrospira sp.]
MTDPTRQADSRCETGIDGLNEILGDGLPANCMYLVQGDPGSGKTTLALQFLLEGVRLGEKTLYITLSETKEELVTVARSHGWSLDSISLFELSAIDSLVRPEARTTVFHPSEVELTKVSEMLQSEIRRIQPARVVFDSLSEFRLMAETALRYRRQLINLKQELAKYNCTALLLDDRMDNSRIGGDPHVLSLTHGVIEMEQLSPDYGRSRRRLRVLKMRGMKFREGYHDYSIEKGGLRVFPRILASDHRADFSPQAVSSGNQEFDELLGGGLDRGTTTLIMGPAGTGKSTLAMQYAAQMAQRNESSVLFAFDEIRGIVLARATAVGLDVERHINTGLIDVQQVDPAELSPGEFGMRIREAVEGGCTLLIIDSLNGYLNAMPGEKYLVNQLHEMSAYLNQKGVVTILILAQYGLIGQAEAPLNLSYLADTVVSVRFFEAAGAVRQALSVIKKRSGGHEKTIREYQLVSDGGLRIGPPLKQFQGVLTGTPSFYGALEQVMERPDGAN